MAFTLTSTAFHDMEMVPQKYTCQGQNISPPLAWKEAPPHTQSFVLVMDDPDAPAGTWDHWLLYGLPATQAALPEGFSGGGQVQIGKNSWGHLAYDGPCPPSGTHRYVFTLYALDVPLQPSSVLDKQGVLEAVKDHLLGKAVLTGRYQKK